MHNKTNDSQNKNTASSKGRMNDISLSLLAVCFSASPFLMIYLNSIGLRLPSYMLLLGVLFPFVGLIFGMMILTRGKGRITKLGRLFSFLAIALPLSIVAFIVIVFIGVVTGIVPLM